MGQVVTGLLLLLCLLTVGQVVAQPTLVIIIDDVGNNGPLGDRAVNLPGPVTLAFLPHTPHAARLARKAADSNKGVMLHAPMANATGAALGPGALTEHMSAEELSQTIRDNINAIPFVQGVNNHMGSRLTADQKAMRAIMPVIQQHGLYFIDSLTNPNSVAQAEARSLGIATDRRDVFLDNDRSLEGLVQQFEQAIDIAKRTGNAILIGHPYPETLDFLETVLPPFIADNDVRLIHASEHLQTDAWLQEENATPYPMSRLGMQFILPNAKSADTH